MSYIFQFNDDMKHTDDYDFSAVWVTEKSYWDKKGHFDDQERGKNFPKEIKDVLGDVMEACFEWDEDQFSKEDIRQLCLKHGWQEVKSRF